MFFDRDKKLAMYCNDRMRRSYIYSESPNFKGRFTKKYCVDETAYKRKKARISEEEEGLSDKEFVIEAFKRGMTVPMIADYVKYSEQHLYRLLKDNDVTNTHDDNNIPFTWTKIKLNIYWLQNDNND